MIYGLSKESTPVIEDDLTMSRLTQELPVEEKRQFLLSL